jgi:hypothetical protein
MQQQRGTERRADFSCQRELFPSAARRSSLPFWRGIMWYITAHYADLAFHLVSAFNAFVMIDPYRRGCR